MDEQLENFGNTVAENDKICREIMKKSVKNLGSVDGNGKKLKKFAKKC